ncbi:MAG: methyl-accepting chemotaxis protein [Desulfovibrionales bacterium]|nr:methyl-accepting chemotaxis protein [Desulfovibrionales bacterium]
MRIKKMLLGGFAVQFIIFMCCMGGICWSLGEQSSFTSSQLYNALLLWGTLFAIGSVVLWMLFANQFIRPLLILKEYAAAMQQDEVSSSMKQKELLHGEALETATAVEDALIAIKDKLIFADGVLNAISEAYPFMTVDNHGLINLMGKRLMEVSGKTGDPADYNGMTIGGFVYGDNSRKTRTDRVIEDGVKIEGETQIEGFGKTHTLAFTADPIKDVTGKQIGALTIYFDLTDIRAQEEQIKAYGEQVRNVAEQAIAVAQEVAESSQIIAEQVKDAADGAQVQSDRAQETATAMEQMSVSSVEVAHHAADAADNAGQARSEAQTGQEKMSTLISSINSVHQEADKLSGFMDKLGDQTLAVGNVITVIQDIADQTNLLALNAAIEAARAGEAGRGFAVVADEVRKLAEKTMEATDEVGAAIQAIQLGAKQSIAGVRHANQAVAESTDIAQNSGDTLQVIVDRVIGTADQVQSIAAAAEEQSATSEQVSRAVEEVTRIATNTAEGMEEANFAIAKLAEQAGQLQTLITTLRAMEVDQT